MLACLGAEELEKENAKKTTALKGQAVFSIAKVRGLACIVIFNVPCL